MSWFVFTENELTTIQNAGHPDLAADLRNRGRWTADDTLLVNATGPESFLLVGCYEKYPRRMAIDPPLNTEPDTK